MEHLPVRMKWTGLAFVCPSSVAIARDMGTNRIQRFLCPDKKWVNRGKPFKTATVVAVVAFVCIANKASAAQCGNTAAGFEAWKNQFAGEARARGVSASTVAALTATTYSTAIAAMIEPRPVVVKNDADICYSASPKKLTLT
jgi:hypothetical protein